MKTLALFLSCVFLLSCNKDKDNSVGPEVDGQEIQDTLNKALGQSDPLTLQVGEFVYTLRTQEIFAGDTPTRLLLEEEGITVTDREVDGDTLIIGIVRELVDHSDPASPHNKFKDVYYLKNPDVPAAELTSPDVAATKALALFDDPAGTDDSTTDDVVYEAPITYTYHNFITREEKVPRPTKVSDREPCPADQDCSLNATHLYYDAVAHQEGQPDRKMQFELLITTDTPYFGNFLKNCVTTLASVEDVRPLVRQCNSVYDYQKPVMQGDHQ
jgi:hypothetical protein